MNAELLVYQGDITQLKVDVIVNAANARLAGGGGVDGAIHRAAGNELYAACRELGGCPTGEARKTPAFNLGAKAIYHAVGPIWHGGNRGEGELLASCYRYCMTLLQRDAFTSIAFPAISCGVYHFPLQQAAAIAIREVKVACEHNNQVEKVIFCCFDTTTTTVYQRLLVSNGVI